MHSDCQLGTAAYEIILSFTVSLTLHYSLKPPPSLSLFVQMKVTLSNEQPVEAEWLWTHCEEYKITRWLSMYSKHQCQILFLASVPVLKAPSCCYMTQFNTIYTHTQLQLLIMNVFYVSPSFAFKKFCSASSIQGLIPMALIIFCWYIGLLKMTWCLEWMKNRVHSGWCKLMIMDKNKNGDLRE